MGGHLVAETLSALGADTAFGVPGIHALAIWEGLRAGPIAVVGTRTELSAGFAADGYARASGRPAPLLLSTGPGALNALTALMEAASAHVPVIAIASQIPSDLIGRGRGYLHELADQRASFAPIVKRAVRATSTAAIPGLLRELWSVALAPPSGPVYLEIPVDLLQAPVGDVPVAPGAAPVSTIARCADDAAVTAAADALAAALAPVIWAGGGVLRSSAQAPLRTLAERLDAPVATTYMGKDALRDDHPLAAGSGCDEAALQELLAGADVLLCVGTELGAETTGQYALAPRGRIIQLDADPARVGVTYPAQPLVGDAALTLVALNRALGDRAAAGGAAAGGAAAGGGAVGGGAVGGGAARVAAVRDRIRAGLATQGRELELGLLDTIERTLPADAITAWDMTILGYWAAAHLRLRGTQRFLYPLGSGTLGYAWPAALGAAVASPGRPVLAVVGNGGLQYTLAELGTAAQHAIDCALLVIDDGGYGILREYQRAAYGQTTGTELPGTDLAAVAAGFGVPVRIATPADLGEQLRWALAQRGPAVVVLRATLTAAQPTL
jgi:acetolactate synthase-1/2/3 large subunit